MKTTQYLISLFAFVAAMLIGCSDEQQSPLAPSSSRGTGSLQKVDTLRYTGYDFPVALLDPGRVRVEGSMRITQHMIVQERLVTTSPLLTGDMIDDLCLRTDIVTGEGNFNAEGTVTPDDPAVGGFWRFSVQGRTTRTGPSEWTSEMDLVGHGHGGTIQGNQIFAHGTMISWSNPPTGWVGTVEGYIKFNGQ